MARILFFFIFSTFAFATYSQSDQVITLQGDTLSGKVTISTNDHSVQSITLKMGKDKMRFKVYEIKSLIKEEEIYNTIKINGTYQLGLLKKEGYLSLYKFMDIEETSSREFSSSVLIKLDGTQLIVPNLGFKKRLEKYLGDCDVVKIRFSENAYKKSDLEKIVDDYNSCIEKNTARLNDEKPAIINNPEKVLKIGALIIDIKEDGSLPDIDSVLEMLSDVSSKLKEDAKIPSYLISALHSSLINHPEFTNQLNSILE